MTDACRTTTITFTCSGELSEWIEEKASKEMSTKSNFVERLVKQRYFKETGAGKQG